MGSLYQADTKPQTASENGEILNCKEEKNCLDCQSREVLEFSGSAVVLVKDGNKISKKKYTYTIY